MTINANITIPHSIEANAVNTMAAERLRTWDGNSKGIAPIEIHNPGSKITCNRKGEGIRLDIVLDDGSKLVMTLKHNHTTKIVAKR